MASTTFWVMLHYGIDGSKIDSANAYEPTIDPDHVIYYATNRQLKISLNTFDQLDFTLFLDDPVATNIKRGKSVIKVFRSVIDPDNAIDYEPPEPFFCGIVGLTMKNGQENTMNITAYSPLWRLQSHFHIDNHYLETNPDTSDFYTQSELMFKLIDLVNDAFGDASFTGIRKGNFNYGVGEPQPTPYFVPRGSNTWANIFDDLMSRPESPDIIPEYKHDEDEPIMMDFSTDRKRGDDISSTMKFNYATDPLILTPNLDDLTEQDQIVPGTNGNYLWVVGQGGPNSGRVAAREESSAAANSDGFGELGVYMVRVDRDEVKRFDALSPIAQAEFAKRLHPTKQYTVQLSPVAGIYYGNDFSVGDVVMLNADRGALQVNNVKQRIYEVTIQNSNNNVESVDISLAKDFLGKVEE